MHNITPTKEQKSAIEAGEGPVLIIAGAGTGKTFTITQRILYLINEKGIKPEEILALTFTEKATGEMEERVDRELSLYSAQANIKTFHSFCDQILKEDGIHLGLSNSYDLMTQADELFFLRKIIREFETDSLTPSSNPTKYLRDIVKHMSRLQDEDISEEKYDEYIANNLESFEDKKELYQELNLIYKKYSKIKIENNKVSFADLITLSLKLLREKRSVKKKWQNRFKYILVDEFQDTNYSQYLLVKELVDNSENPNIMVVADDDQSIYKFRGAAISNVLNFTKDFASAERIVLTENRRSVQEILDKSYKLIQHNNPDRLEIKEGIDKKLVEKGSDLLRFPDPVEFRYFSKFKDESNGIALEIKDIVKSDNQLSFESQGLKYKDIAVLIRANQQAEDITEALERSGIPYQFDGPKKLFMQDTVKDLLNFLRVCADYSDNIAMNGYLAFDLWEVDAEEYIRLNSAAREKEISLFKYIEESEPEYHHIVNYIKSTWIKIKKKSSIWKILYEFINESGYLERISEYEISENGVVNDISSEMEREARLKFLGYFFDFVKEYERNNPGSRIFDFIEYVDIIVDNNDSPTVKEFDVEIDAVNIITVHSSKGLEYPVVFIPGLSRNKFPLMNKSDILPVPDQLISEVLPEGDFHEQEERRLFYVALTRGKSKVYLSASESYTSSNRKSKISPFVVEIFDEKELMNKINNPISYDLNFEVNLNEEEKIKEFGAKKVTTLSFSQMQTFKSCPRKYWYSYILKIPQKPSPAIAFGNIIHKCLEEFYKEVKENSVVSKELLFQIFEGVWSGAEFYSKDQAETFKKRAESSLEKFYNKLYDEGDNPIELEKAFSLKFDDVSLIGKIDRIDEKNGELEIIDYKTTENKKKTELSTDYIRQLAVYSLAAEKSFDVSATKFSFLFVDLGEKISTDLKRIEKMKEKIKQEIGEIALKINNREFDPNPGFNCKYCDFNKICKYAKL